MGKHHSNTRKPNKQARYQRKMAKRRLYKGLRADSRTGYKRGK